MKYNRLVADTEYDKRRKIALEVQAKFPEAHPCVRGKAECCTDSVRMVRGDIELLREAIRSGKLPRAVLDQAKLNLESGPTGQCAFLAANRDCMLKRGDETYQPIQCLTYGLGGILRDNNVTFQAKARARTGIDQQISYGSDVHGASACESCARSMSDQDMKASFLDFEKARKTRNYVLEQVKLGVKPNLTTNEFVRDYQA